MLPSEDVASAVFDLWHALTTKPLSLVVTLSRAIQPAAQMQSDQCPALFQVQMGQFPDNRTRQLGGQLARIMVFELFIYVWGDSSTDVPASTQLNNIVDAVINQIPTDADGNPNPVPLFVNDVPCPIWWDPEISYMEAVPGVSSVSIARIEVKVAVPPAFLVTP